MSKRLTLSVVDEKENLIVGVFYLHEDEAEAILFLIECFQSNRKPA